MCFKLDYQNIISIISNILVCYWPISKKQQKRKHSEIWICVMRAHYFCAFSRARSNPKQIFWRGVRQSFISKADHKQKWVDTFQPRIRIIMCHIFLAKQCAFILKFVRRGCMDCCYSVCRKQKDRRWMIKWWLWGFAWSSSSRNPLDRWEETVQCAVPRFSNLGAFGVKTLTILSKLTLREKTTLYRVFGFSKRSFLVYGDAMPWSSSWLRGCVKSSTNARCLLKLYAPNLTNYIYDNHQLSAWVYIDCQREKGK